MPSHISGFELAIRRSGAIRLMIAAALGAVVLLSMPVAAQALSWSGVTKIDEFGAVSLTALSCPAAGQCTAVDDFGRELTFRPGQTSLPAAVTVDPGLDSDAVSCPSATICTMVDDTGNQATFDPQTGVTVSRTNIDSTNALNGIACLSTSVCVTVDSNGTVLEYNIVSGLVMRASQIDPGRSLDGIACLSGSECVTVDNGGTEFLFAPGTGTVLRSGDLDGSQSIASVACPSSAVCIAVDENGGEVSFDPTSGGAFSIVSSAVIDDTSGTNYPFNSVDCLSTTECVAVDDRGAEFAVNPSVSSGYLLSGDGLGGWYIDGSSSGPSYDLPAVNCASGTCITTSDVGQVLAFNPVSGVLLSSAQLGLGGYLESVSCPSSGQCTAVDFDGDETSFSPSTPSGATPYPIGFELLGLACATTSECVAVDDSGDEVTFNPASPSGATHRNIDGGQSLNSVACPATNECVAVDGDGRAVTFDPTSGATPQLAAIDDTNYLVAISCPTTSQCTAVDDFGGAVTFNPSSSTVPAAVPVDSGHFANGLSCASVSVCVVVDSDGDEVEFDPQVGVLVAAGKIDPDFALTDVSCPANGQCYAVDYGGSVLSGNPASPGSWTATYLANATALQSISCAPTAVCAAVDDVGDEYTGLGGNWSPVPANQGAPTISGTTTAGQTLTEGHGSWAYSPTSYSYQWEDCNTSGGGCTPIGGATGQAYTLAASDVGHTIVVQEVASNGTGASTAVSSAPTAIVASPPVVIAPASATITSVHVRRLKVTVDLSCSGAGGQTCAGAITMRSVKKLSIVVGNAAYSLAANATAAVSVSVGGAGKRAIAKAKAYKLATLVSLSGSGNTARDITLKYRRFASNTFGLSLVNNGSYTRIEGLQATGLARGDRVLASCKGNGCSFKKTTVKVRKSPVALESLVSHSHFHAASLTLEATGPGYVGAIFTINMHGASHKATFSELCLPPGAKQPAKCR